jgi:hypothetical protein
LRTVDIVALAGALARDRETIEQRIADALGCSPVEARRLHAELLRRKVILPVAGLAAGMAALAGAAQAPSSSGTSVPTEPVVATAPLTTQPTLPTLPARVPPTAPTTSAPSSTTTTVPAVPRTTPTTAPEPQTDATVPPSQQPADVPISIAGPQPGRCCRARHRSP